MGRSSIVDYKGLLICYVTTDKTGNRCGSGCTSQRTLNGWMVTSHRTGTGLQDNRMSMTNASVWPTTGSTSKDATTTTATSAGRTPVAIGQWRRQDFVTGGSEVWVNRGSRVRSPLVPVVCLCINVALCSTALQWICRVIREEVPWQWKHTHIT